MTVILVCLIKNDRDQGIHANEIKPILPATNPRNVHVNIQQWQFSLYIGIQYWIATLFLLFGIHSRLRNKQVSVECKHWKSLAKDVKLYINNNTAKCETSIIHNLDMFM